MWTDSFKWLQDSAQSFDVELSAVTLVSVWLFSFGLAKKLLAGGRRRDRGRRDLAALAEKLGDRLTGFYNDAVTLMLSLVDRLAGDGFLARAASARPDRPHPFRQPAPWSSGLYDLTLILTLFYPLLFVFAGWVWGGQSAQGLQALLVAEPEEWRRGFAFAGLAVFVTLVVLAMRRSGWRRLLYFAYAGAVAAAVAVDFALVASASAGAVALDFVFAFAFAIFFAAAVVVAFAFAVVVAGAFAFAFVFTLAGAVAFAFALALARPVTGAFVEAISLAGYFAGTIAFVSAFAIVFAIGIATALAVAGAVAYVESRARGARVRALFHILHWLVFAGLAIAALYFLSPSDSHVVGGLGLIIVFLSLLPLANAPLDWLSLGLTRGLLRYGLARGGTWRIAAISLVDIGLAAALMFPLAAITVAVVGIANWSALAGGGALVLPIVATLNALAVAPADPQFYWIYLMLFSTLVPSLLHVLGGLVSLALACLQPIFSAAMRAQEFTSTEKGENVPKDTKLLYWYPALAASGLTALVAVFTLISFAVPYVRAAAVTFAQLLLATAEWTAGFFPD